MKVNCYEVYIYPILFIKFFIILWLYYHTYFFQICGIYHTRDEDFREYWSKGFESKEYKESNKLWRERFPIDGLNKVCNNIAASYMKFSDESMKAIHFWTTSNGDLPHFSWILRNKEPLGTEFNNAICSVTVSLIFISILTWPPWISSMTNIRGWNSLPGAEARGALGTIPIGLRATLITSPSNLCLLWFGPYTHLLSLLLYFHIPLYLSLQFICPRLLPHRRCCMPRSYTSDIQIRLLPPSPQEFHSQPPLHRQTQVYDRKSQNLLCNPVLAAVDIHPNII